MAKTLLEVEQKLREVKAMGDVYEELGPLASRVLRPTITAEYANLMVEGYEESLAFALGMYAGLTFAAARAVATARGCSPLTDAVHTTLIIDAASKRVLKLIEREEEALKKLAEKGGD